MEEKDLLLEEEFDTPERPDYEEEIAQIIKNTESLKELREKLEDYHENDIADAIKMLSSTERVKLYRSIGMEKTAEIFTYLDDVSEYVEELDSEKAADILEIMDADDAVDILEELSETKREELEHLIDSESRKDIDLISSYEEDEIGSRMTTNFIVINKGQSIAEAMKSLVKQAADNDNISTIYTLNDDGTFYGALNLTDLIRARKDDELEPLIITSYPYVYAHESVDEVWDELKDYSEDSIPVLDNDKRILGVITSQDIVEFIDDEMGEDYAKFAGLLAEEDLKEPLLESLKKRVPWLIALLFLGLLVSSVVGIFENVVAEIPLIVTFQSMILDMAGNVGTQSLAVTIRVLSDEELSFKQLIGLVFKEVRVGFVNGVLLGVLSFVVTGSFICFIKGNSLGFSLLIAGCIGLSLLLAMLISSLSGTTIPIIFKKMGFDPAVASGPLITTINDLVAVLMYYGMAYLLLFEAFKIV